LWLSTAQVHTSAFWQQEVEFLRKDNQRRKIKVSYDPQQRTIIYHTSEAIKYSVPRPTWNGLLCRHKYAAWNKITQDLWSPQINMWTSCDLHHQKQGVPNPWTQSWSTSYSILLMMKLNRSPPLTALFTAMETYQWSSNKI
jgi:hypothetical protein